MTNDDEITHLRADAYALRSALEKQQRATKSERAARLNAEAVREAAQTLAAAARVACERSLFPGRGPLAAALAVFADTTSATDHPVSALLIAEADNAGLIALARTLTRTVARQVTGYDDAVVLVLRVALNDLNRALDQPHPGAALLVELDAARAARETAEADNAWLLAILREIDLTCSRPEHVETLLAHVRESEHPGRAIMGKAIAELDAARAVVAAMRLIDKHVVGAYVADQYGSVEPCEECGEMREIAAQALAAHDAATKARE